MFIYVLNYNRGSCEIIEHHPKMSQRIDNNFVESLLEEAGYHIDEISYMYTEALNLKTGEIL